MRRGAQPLTDAEIAAILDTYGDGSSIKDTALITHHSTSTISKYVTAAFAAGDLGPRKKGSHIPPRKRPQA
jgi:hypothetical protein